MLRPARPSPATRNPDRPAPAVLQALAALHAAELDLRTPSSPRRRAGIVSQTDRLQHGQYVTPAVPVLALVATGDSWIEANFKETDLDPHAARASRSTSLRHLSATGRSKGEVGSIGAGTGSEFSLLPAQNATGNWVKVVQRVPVRVALDHRPDGRRCAPA